MQGPWRLEEGIRSPGTGIRHSFGATMWVLAINLRFPRREASVISPCPQLYLLIYFNFSLIPALPTILLLATCLAHLIFC